jgi:D-alanyl-D-alanine carboxypeptidase
VARRKKPLELRAEQKIVQSVVGSVARALVVGLALGTLAAPSRASSEALLLIDAASGKVLQAENATSPWYPASLSKLMTTYVTLKAVKEGRISFDTLLTFSPNAVAQAPSKMGFRAGIQVTVDNALKMLLVHSANDIAVVLAEGIDGSIDKFADEMTRTSRQLGMTQSSWVNPNGLPEEGQITSARDLGILARALMHDFPEYDFYWHIPSIKFGRRVMRNYNKLLAEYPGADGMKTGFICASGFNLVASATRGDRRLIAIVLGAPSSAARAAKAAALLERGFVGSSLSWLLPSLGTVDALQPIVAAPPDLHDQVCGPHRKRPAAENEDDDEASGNSDGDHQNAFMLSNLKGSGASLLTGNPLAAVPPVVVFTGAKRPAGNGDAEAAAATLKRHKPAKTATATEKNSGAAATKKPAPKTAAEKPANSKASEAKAKQPKTVQAKANGSKPKAAPSAQ